MGKQQNNIGKKVDAYGCITLDGKDYYTDKSLAGQIVTVDTTTLEVIRKGVVYKLQESPTRSKLFDKPTSNPYIALHNTKARTSFLLIKLKIKRINPIMRLYYWIQFKFSYSGIVSTQSEAGKTAESFNPKNSSK